MKHFFVFSAALALVGSVALFGAEDATAEEAANCPAATALEAEVKRLFAEYGTLDNRKGQGRKAEVKQQIVEAQAKLAAAQKACAAQPPAKPAGPTPGDRCSPAIGGNGAAAGVCAPVCEKQGLAFAGNWSCDRNHPPVQACSAKGEGACVCGCGPKAPPAPTPGDRCSPAIGGNGAAAGVCAPVCEKQGLSFAGNWSCDRNHPPVQACSAKGEGACVCGCGPKK